MGILTVAALESSPGAISASLRRLPPQRVGRLELGHPVSFRDARRLVAVHRSARRGVARRRWFGVAAMVAACGVCSPPRGHVLLRTAHNLFLAARRVLPRGYRRSLRRHTLQTRFSQGAAVMAVSFTVVALPMFYWISGKPERVHRARRHDTVFDDPGWESLTSVTRRRGFSRAATWTTGRPCATHGRTPATPGYAALARPLLLALAALGMILGWTAMAARRWAHRRARDAGGIGSSGRRRGEAGVRQLPFLALFAGLALDVSSSLASSRVGSGRATAAAIALLLPLAILAPRGIDNYSGGFRGSQEEHYTFAPELTNAAFYMRDLPRDEHVYFYSARAPITHEIVRYIAPGLSGEDRSREFGGGAVTIDRTAGIPVFVLMDGTSRNWRSSGAATPAARPTWCTAAAARSSTSRTRRRPSRPEVVRLQASRKRRAKTSSTERIRLGSCSAGGPPVPTGRRYMVGITERSPPGGSQKRYMWKKPVTPR